MNEDEHELYDLHFHGLPLLILVPQCVYQMGLDCEWEEEIESNVIERDIVTSVNTAFHYAAYP
jgi:hypothetical protein